MRILVHRYCPGVEITNEGKVKIAISTTNLVLTTILFTMSHVHKLCMRLPSLSFSTLSHV